jgi:hypothetical protein
VVPPPHVGELVGQQRVELVAAQLREEVARQEQLRTRGGRPEHRRDPGREEADRGSAANAEGGADLGGARHERGRSRLRRLREAPKPEEAPRGERGDGERAEPDDCRQGETPGQRRRDGAGVGRGRARERSSRASRPGGSGSGVGARRLDDPCPRRGERLRDGGAPDFGGDGDRLLRPRHGIARWKERQLHERRSHELQKGQEEQPVYDHLPLRETRDDPGGEGEEAREDRVRQEETESLVHAVTSARRASPRGVAGRAAPGPRAALRSRGA